MGWRGTIRSLRAAARAAEQDARRRQREMEREEREYEKMLELEHAAHEVDVFENYIERITSIHKEYNDPIDWEQWTRAPEPPEPQRLNTEEQEALEKKASYKPGFFDWLLRRETQVLQSLDEEIELARKDDEIAYSVSLREFRETHEDWQHSRDLALRILSGDLQAYRDAVEKLHSFQDIDDLGSSVFFEFEDPRLLCTVVKVRGEDVVPRESKSLLKSGKLSVKRMPIGRFYEIYQDYVCGAALRVAGEVFALLPVEAVLITSVDDLLNTQTGHLEEQAILSVAIPRSTFEGLNLQLIDPSDAMNNFLHRMNFKKMKGFCPVEPIEKSEVDLLRIKP